MKIVHIVVVGPYTEGMTYQENILPDCQVKNGHDVTVIANCTYWNRSRISYTKPIVKCMDTGVKLIRLPFVHIGNMYVTEKLRFIKGLYETLKDERPDFIFLHDFATVSTGQVVKYLKENPATAFVMDSHTTFENSGRNWVSRHLLHGVIYKHYARKVYEYAKAVYYIVPEAKKFLMEVYKFPTDKIVFLPLGGTVLPEDEYRSLRERIRAKYAIGKDDTVFLHTGKLDAEKKTIELLEAFCQRENKAGSLLFIIGETDDSDRRRKIEELVRKDSTIHFLGWKSGDELAEFLCAADIYLQPGSQSATVQLAACNRCGVVTQDYESYRSLFGENGAMLSQPQDLLMVINRLCGSKDNVMNLRRKTFDIAQQLLDYEKQSEMILVEGHS